ncbi:MAG TPA: TerB family tellurite resistance protein [Polyangiaceae bacterium]
MHEQDIAIVKALVPVAWADGEFAEQESETLEALLDAYGASDEEKKALKAYASQKRTLDDIQLQDLSADDRRVLLQHAVLLSYADGKQTPDEVEFLVKLAAKLKIPDDEAKGMMAAAGERAQKFLHLI